MEINNKYGYVRISSKSQESNSSIESQKQQLIQNGIEEQNIFVEVGSGANEIKNRPVFQKLINQKLKDIFFKKNITFVALDLPTSVDLATNKLMATTLSAMAEFENNRRKERQKLQ
jgi:DNA invertase Pin-like site-specific DNA recombinase